MCNKISLMGERVTSYEHLLLADTWKCVQCENQRAEYVSDESMSTISDETGGGGGATPKTQAVVEQKSISPFGSNYGVDAAGTSAVLPPRVPVFGTDVAGTSGVLPPRTLASTLSQPTKLFSNTGSWIGSP